MSQIYFLNLLSRAQEPRVQSRAEVEEVLEGHPEEGQARADGEAAVGAAVPAAADGQVYERAGAGAGHGRCRP